MKTHLVVNTVVETNEKLPYQNTYSRGDKIQHVLGLWLWTHASLSWGSSNFSCFFVGREPLQGSGEQGNKNGNNNTTTNSCSQQQ
jgi:hypothetical protein